MPVRDELAQALDAVREALADPDLLVQVVAGGRRRGSPAPEPARLTGRVVDLRAGRVLQLTGVTGPLVQTVNVPYGEPAAFADALTRHLDQPFASWRVERTDTVLQVRVTKKGRAFVHRGPGVATGVPSRDHDQAKARLIEPDDPLFTVLGADAAKRRQVDAFLRSLQATLTRAEKRNLVPAGPVHAVDLGCGNAYLTFAAHRYLARQRPGSHTTGIEQRDDLVARSRLRAAEANLDGLTFRPGLIGDLAGTDRVDVVLALHACDTATDDSLAQAVRWRAPVILAAPCCHHDVQRQLAAVDYPPAQHALVASPILRERFADVLTDALRAAVLRLHGYRVDVVEFVDSAHTPRNLMIRAVRTGHAPTQAHRDELDDLLATWRVRPRLLDLLPTH